MRNIIFCIVKCMFFLYFWQDSAAWRQPIQAATCCYTGQRYSSCSWISSGKDSIVMMDRLNHVYFASCHVIDILVWGFELSYDVLWYYFCLLLLFCCTMLYKHGLCCHVMSVCPSITFMNSAKTSNHIFKFFLPSGSGVCICCLSSGGTNLYGMMMYGG